jgi:hypothetical protein
MAIFNVKLTEPNEVLARGLRRLQGKNQRSCSCGAGSKIMSHLGLEALDVIGSMECLKPY